MSRMIDKLSEFGQIFAKRNINPPGTELISLMVDLEEFFNPKVIRTDADVMAEILERMREDLEALADQMSVNKPALMKEHGLDPHNRSDSTRVDKFLKECGLLQYRQSEPAQWVRRIAAPVNGQNGNGTNGSSAAHNAADD